LAKHYDSVILSADSRQFYKELNIGTAKPNEKQLNAVRHYFIDTKPVTELYGAGHYERDVLKTLEELYEQHNLIFLVGGSGLYIDAVLNGVDDFIEVPATIRTELNEMFARNGLKWLQEELVKKDKAYFDIVDTNNPQRIIRALEVIEHTGIPYSGFLNKKKTKRDFIPIKLFINLKREKLYERINKRVDLMMEQGLLEEVKELVKHKELNALKTVGYKELYDYLEGRLSLEEAINKIKQHTRNYAKRQITWFKNKDNFKEFDPDQITGIKAYIDEITDVKKKSGS
jgi:tRNA dimethylallyltransferase